MTFPTIRIARATNNLALVAAFYQDSLGCAIIASFTDHDGFDGIILGFPGAPYHFEFTSEHGRPESAKADPDELIVFYFPDAAEWAAAVERVRGTGRESVASHNPYWDRHGVTFLDPDGHRVVLQNSDWPQR